MGCLTNDQVPISFKKKILLFKMQSEDTKYEQWKKLTVLNVKYLESTVITNHFWAVDFDIFCVQKADKSSSDWFHELYCHIIV